MILAKDSTADHHQNDVIENKDENVVTITAHAGRRRLITTEVEEHTYTFI